MTARSRRVAAVLVLVLLGLVLAATRQDTGLRVVDSATGPGEASLTLSADVDAELSHLAVTGPDGRPVPAGPPVAGPANVLTVPVDLEPGSAYSLTYHVIGRDGGVASGEIGTTGATASAHDHGHGVDPLSAVLLLINLGVVLVVGWLLLTRPSPRSTPE